MFFLPSLAICWDTPFLSLYERICKYSFIGGVHLNHSLPRFLDVGKKST
jgi:hypothetical protein